MELRIIEVIVPEASRGVVEGASEELPALERWIDHDTEAGRVRVSLLLRGEHTEAAMQELGSRVDSITDARILLLPVEATVPHPEEEDEEADAAPGEEGPAESEGETAAPRISLEELHNDVHQMSQLSKHFVTMVALATFVAAIGLIRNNGAVVIGSMVIAPLLGPSVGLALASTLADPRLARVALKATIVGVLVSAVVSVALGTVFPVDPNVHELLLRSEATFWDVALGLAVGAAGVLSVTTGISQALVGVMVAVALLPPLVASGLFAGSGLWDRAIEAAQLLATYVIGINLSGVLVFIMQGVRPRQYWEAARARRATVASIAIWTALLALLVLGVWRGPGIDLPETLP